MGKNRVRILFVILWAACTMLALLWGLRIDWPDYSHVNYGLPLAWSTHVLNTLAGPVDIWHVDLTILFVDLLIWHGILLVALAIEILRAR